MIKLINDDCLNAMDKLIDEGVIIDVIITDPPFNINYKYNSYIDKLKEKTYYDMLADAIQDTPCVIIHFGEQLHKLSIRLGKAPEKIVSWVYNSNTPKQHRQIAFYGIKPDFKKVRQSYKNQTDKRIMKRIAEGKTAKLYDWWNINQVKNVSHDKTDHPCQMPLKVMENIIGILPEGITILDPFMGSGTTGVACKNLNRDFIGIELDKKYFNIAKERLSK